jgi:hypothetical protein
MPDASLTIGLFGRNHSTSRGAAARVKPKASLRALGISEIKLRSCGAAIELLPGDPCETQRHKKPIRLCSLAPTQSPLRGSELWVTVYPRLADSPWA